MWNAQNTGTFIANVNISCYHKCIEKKVGVIMKLHESGEDYLESILVLEQRKGKVRSIDVANDLKVTKPSVSRAIHILETDGYIQIDESSLLHLTQEGRKIAEKIYERHQVFTRLLKSIGVDEKIAAEDACRIEHAVSEESFAALKKFIEEHL